MNKYLFLLCLPFLLMTACIPYKKVIYMQKDKGGDIVVQKKGQYKLHPHDVLLVNISSPNPQVSEFFNLNQGSQSKYEISDSGYIYLPVWDSVKVKEMSIPEVQTMLQALVRTHVTDATVVIKLANFRVTVLGEVQFPNVINFEGAELTIIDALGMCKDITDFGNKKKVTLIRKEGSTERFITLDLTNRDFISSDFFYLQPNDIIYVPPLRAKNIKLNVGQLTLVLGFSSLIFLIINAVKK